MTRRTFFQVVSAGLAVLGITRTGEAMAGNPRPNGVILPQHGLFMRYEHGKWFKG